MTVPEVERADRTNRANRSYNRIMVVMVGIACAVVVAAAIVLFVKIDGKVSTIEATTSHVASVQHTNTLRSDCQDQGFNAILNDASLALRDDKNPADYLKAKKC